MRLAQTLSKLLTTTLLLLTACAWPIEEHGGIAPKPAHPDGVILAGGAALDTGLQLARVRHPWRGALVLGTAFAVRYSACCGRSEASHLLIISGAIPIEALGLLLRGRP